MKTIYFLIFNIEIGGVSEGGNDLGFNPLFAISYPEPIRESDVLKIIKDIPSVSSLQDKGLSAMKSLYLNPSHTFIRT